MSLNMAAQHSPTTTDDTEIWRTLVGIALAGGQLTNADVKLVTNCLLDLNFPATHASNPRLCVVLLKTQRFDLFSKLLDEGVNDLWLPLPKRLVGKWLEESAIRSFMSSQELCLDENVSIETPGRHFCVTDVAELGFQRLELLGAGGYGEVHRVRDQRSGRIYARKTMTRPNKYLRHKEVLLNFGKEVMGMRRVHHHHCVDLVASCTDMDSVMVFSSPVADMDLSTFLSLKYLEQWQTELLVRSFGCITSALAYLHGLHIRHDDLKPNNILVHGSNVLLTDFGFCLDSSDSGVTTTADRPAHLSLRYSAPEVFNHDPRSRLSDIWSLGCVLCDVISRLHGFTPQDMKSFWTNTGTKIDSYSENPGATMDWFHGLSSESRQRWFTTQSDLTQEYRWLCSFLGSILLERERLMRPTAEQVLHRLARIRTTGWISDCCKIPKKPGIIKAHRGTDKQAWLLVDLLNADKHLACVFIDARGSILASSDSMSSYRTLQSFMDARSIRALKCIQPTTATSNQWPMPRRNEPTSFKELVKSLYICTDLAFYSMAPTLCLDSWIGEHPCVMTAIVTTAQLERRPMHKEPISALIFNSYETLNISAGPSSARRREHRQVLALSEVFPEPSDGQHERSFELERFTFGGDGSLYCRDCICSFRNCDCRRFISQPMAMYPSYAQMLLRKSTLTELETADRGSADEDQGQDKKPQPGRPAALLKSLNPADPQSAPTLSDDELNTTGDGSGTHHIPIPIYQRRTSADMCNSISGLSWGGLSVGS